MANDRAIPTEDVHKHKSKDAEITAGGHHPKFFD